MVCAIARCVIWAKMLLQINPPAETDWEPSLRHFSLKQFKFFL